MHVSSGSSSVLLASICTLLGKREERYDEVKPGCGTTDRWFWEFRGPKLGAGTYGAVRQVQNGQGQLYAMKEAVQTQYYEQLENEINALRAFDGCPGVVKLKDGRPCKKTTDKPIAHAYVMDLYQQDLGNYMKEKPVCFGYIFVEVMQAVHCMHSRDWIHRDIKPDNVFLSTPSEHPWECSDPGFQVGVGDFGMSVKIGSSHRRVNPNRRDNYPYMHPDMFGSQKFKAAAELDWHSVHVLYCDLLEKLVSWDLEKGENHELYMKSLNKDELERVATLKGFTAFEDVWVNHLKSPEGNSECLSSRSLT